MTWENIVIGVIAGCALFFGSKYFNIIEKKLNYSNGMAQDCYVRIGGRKQFLQIRGNDMKNPIILFLHNGPSITYSYLSYFFLNGFQDKYTIVYWDQSGCGRSYEPGESGITYEGVSKDLEGIVEYILQRFYKRKIILIGHCIGSYLGIDYIKKHPEKVEAFISIGQLIQTRESIQKSIERVLCMCQKQERSRVPEYLKLRNAFQYMKKIDFKTCLRYQTLRKKIASKFCPNSVTNRIKRGLLILISPDFTLKDIRWMFLFRFQGAKYMEIYAEYLQKLLDADVVKEFGTCYDVPFYLVYGERDYFTQPEMIDEFYKTLVAPRKNLIHILDAGHHPHLEQPKTFVSTVRKLLMELHNQK